MLIVHGHEIRLEISVEIGDRQRVDSIGELNPEIDPEIFAIPAEVMASLEE